LSRKYFKLNDRKYKPNMSIYKKIHNDGNERLK
jgi:hypothetical protein